MDNKNEVQILNFTGLRGYAILLIFLSHCGFGVNEAGINPTTWWGGLGVELFILLSGYLLILRHSEGISDYRSYVKQKIKKFYPLHVATLILAIPFALKELISINWKSWIALAMNALLLQSWVPLNSIYFSFNSVSWYLCLTVFFVIMSPLVIRLWKAIGNRFVPYTIIGLIAFEIVWCFIFLKYDNAHWLIYILPLIRLSDFIIGGGYFTIGHAEQRTLKNHPASVINHSHLNIMHSFT